MSAISIYTDEDIHGQVAAQHYRFSSQFRFSDENKSVGEVLTRFQLQKRVTLSFPTKSNWISLSGTNERF